MVECIEVTEKEKKTSVHVFMYLVCPLLFELVELFFVQVTVVTINIQLYWRRTFHNTLEFVSLLINVNSTEIGFV